MPRSPKPIRVSLLSLLRDGSWGGLRLGMTRQDLVRKLGMPTRWSVSDTEHEARRRGVAVAGWALSPLLVYSAVEFHFPEDPAGGCWMIFSDDLDALRRPDSLLHVLPAGLSEGMSEDSIHTLLSSEQISFHREPFPPMPDQIRLRMHSGACLGLTSDPEFFDSKGYGYRLFCVEVILSK